MALTRAQAETVAVKRVGPLLTAAGLSTAVNGTNGDLAQPISWAIRQLGLPVISVTDVDDGDLENVPEDDIDALLDLSEYKTLETILGNLDDVDVSEGPFSKPYSQLANQVRHMIEKKLVFLQRTYGFNGSYLQAGVIDLNFQAREDDEVDDV